MVAQSWVLRQRMSKGLRGHAQRRTGMVGMAVVRNVPARRLTCLQPHGLPQRRKLELKK